MKFFSIFVLTIILLTLSCKQKDNDEENNDVKDIGNTDIDVVTFNDIKDISYPVAENRKIEFQKFGDIIDSKIASDNSDRQLCQMIEKVSIRFIEKSLRELAKNTSQDEKPNIFILLEQIDEMRNINEENISEYIDKAKGNNDIDKLNIAIFGLPNERVQAKAVEAMSLMGKKEFVKYLTKRLYHAIPMGVRGMDAVIYREQLRQSLVKALGNCTGLDFSNYDPLNNEDVYVIIKRCMNWLEKNQE